MSGITEEIIEELTEKANVLTTERKRRGKTVPEGLLTADDIKQFGVVGTHPGLHSASVPGLLALDISVADTNKVVTGGADKNATVFNKETETVVAQLRGHTKKVNRVVYHMREDVVITGSHDNTVRVYLCKQWETLKVVGEHTAIATGVRFGQNATYLASTSMDRTLKIYSK